MLNSQAEAALRKRREDPNVQVLLDELTALRFFAYETIKAGHMKAEAHSLLLRGHLPAGMIPR